MERRLTRNGEGARRSGAVSFSGALRSSRGRDVGVTGTRKSLSGTKRRGDGDADVDFRRGERGATTYFLRDGTSRHWRGENDDDDDEKRGLDGVGLGWCWSLESAS